MNGARVVETSGPRGQKTREGVTEPKKTGGGQSKKYGGVVGALRPPRFKLNLDETPAWRRANAPPSFPTSATPATGKKRVHL